jgi:signal transduction histidine kinase
VVSSGLISVLARSLSGPVPPYAVEMLWPRRTASAAAGLAAVLLMAAVVFTVQASNQAAVVNLAVGLVVAPLAAVLGVFTSRRTPGAQVGVWLALLGLGVAAIVARETWSQALVATGDPEAWSWLIAALAEAAWWILVAVALLLLHFPDGRLPSPRWRWVPPTLVVSAIVNQVYGALETAPFSAPFETLARPFPKPPVWLDVLSLVAFALLLVLSLACAASLVGRFRRSGRRERAQIKWVAIAGIGVPLYPVLCLAEIALWGRPLWFSATVGVVALVGIPLSTAVAILRHDLYDVDKALSGTVTWALLTAVLAVLYLVSSMSMGVLVGRGSEFAAAAGAAVCALALVPLRGRIQRGVDARVYPLRRAAFEALDGLHREVSAGRARPEQLEATLRAGLRDPGLRVGYRLPGSSDHVDTDRVPLTETAGVPIVLGGVEIGLIVPADGDASTELLREVADRSTTLVEVVRLRLELSGALEEVEASRARLVQIGYEERRRLERDLHDGAQQRLVSLGMAIRVAQRHLGDGTVDVDGLLDESVAELGIAVAELRQIAHGLRPSSLDDGLPAALARLVRSVPVTVEMDVHSGPLPDDVATTAYFVISEAVTNAVKHAQATRIQLCVARVDGHVVVRITDDGCGGALLSAQSGLADRVAALGGSLKVASPRGSGTTVEAALPCAS